MDGPRETRRADAYVGTHASGSAEVYVLSSRGATPLPMKRRPVEAWAGSPWARRSLAEAILADAGGIPPPSAVQVAFIEEILGKLPHDGFVLLRGTVEAWLLKSGRQVRPASAERRRRSTG